MLTVRAVSMIKKQEKSVHYGLHIVCIFSAHQEHCRFPPSYATRVMGDLETATLTSSREVEPSEVI